MKKCIVMIILLIVTATAVSSQENGNLLNNSADFWFEMNNMGKALYVQGVLSGTYAMYEELRRNDPEIAARLENIIPWKVRIQEIIDIIDETYRRGNRDVPIWYLVINFKEAAQKLNSQGAWK